MKSREGKLIRFIERALRAISKVKLPKYSSKFSPRRYTQHQLAAILALKIYLKTTYRDAIDFLRCIKTPKKLELGRIPHFTTLQKFFRRTSTVFFQSLILNISKSAGMVALDSTGLFADHTSKYMASRPMSQSGRVVHTIRKYTKMSIAIDISSLSIVNVTASDGPFPDFDRLRPLIKPLTGLSLVLADKGFDSAKNYDYVSRKGAFPVIAQREGRTKRGRLRRFVYGLFDSLKPLYGKRWHVEIVFSALKRRFGDRLYSRKARLVKKEVFLRAWVWNLHREICLSLRFLEKVFSHTKFFPISQLSVNVLHCIRLILIWIPSSYTFFLLGNDSAFYMVPSLLACAMISLASLLQLPPLPFADLFLQLFWSKTC